MSEAQAQTDPNTEIFDRLLGRKGDPSRLDPAIHAVSRFFSERLHSVVHKAGFEAEFEVTAHRHTSAKEALGKLESGAVCAFLGAHASHPLAFLVADYPATSVISELVLGGDPEFASLSASRPPTAMESELVQQFSGLVGEALRTTLSIAETPKALRIIQKADEIRDGEDEEPVVAFDIQMMFGEAKPVLSLAITHHMMLQMARPVRETIKKPQPAAASIMGHAPKEASTPNRNALTVKVPVSGSVLLPPISLGELGVLRPGDVLALSEEGNATVKLKVKGRPLYDCSLGRKGANYAMCLERPHEAMADALSGIGLAMPNQDSEEIYDE
jgi:flagellar motor switch protein FliM